MHCCGTNRSDQLGVYDVLRIDSVHRYEGVDCDLYTLEDYHEMNERFVIDVPFLANDVGGTNVADNYGTFRSQYSETYLEFPQKPEFWRGLFVAGGSVSEILTRHVHYPHSRDIDIFLYGLTTQDADRKVDRIYKFIKKIRAGSVNIIRTTNCITFQVEGGPIVQVVLRIYNSISEILHAFDLGSSAVGFNNRGVYFTMLSMFAYTHMTNIIDPARRSTTYEYRLMKYRHYGFRIAFPCMDMTKLPDPKLRGRKVEQCELPYLPFMYRSIAEDQKSIEFSAWIRRTPPESDYDFCADRNTVLLHNIHALQVEPLCSWGYSRDSLREAYDIYLAEEDIECFYRELLTSLYKNQPVYLTKFRKCLSVANFDKLFHAYASDDRQSVSRVIDDCILETWGLLKDARARNSSGLTWMTKNVMTQLSASFNPIIEDPSVWYGEYYSAPSSST